MYTDDILAKKQSANWYIAATHYLTAGLVVPFLGGIVVRYLLSVVPGMSFPIYEAVNIISSLVLLYGGVVYSSRYINKTSFIKDAHAVVILATSYLVALSLIYFVGMVWINDLTFELVGAFSIFLTLFEISLRGLVFYAASKKYIKAG